MAGPYGRFTLAAIPSRYYENMPDPYNYTDPGGPGQDVYTVIPATRINFDVIRIVLGLPSDGANVILKLCEVSVFGGKYDYKVTKWSCIKFKLLRIL